MVVFNRIPTEHVSAVWDKVEPLLSLALEHGHGEWSEATVKEACISGHYDLWVAVDDDIILAAFTTFFAKYPNMRVLEGAFLGSEPNEMIWTAAQEYMRKWAKHNGCARFVVTGRKGWVKALRPYGFELDCVKMGVWV